MIFINFLFLFLLIYLSTLTAFIYSGIPDNILVKTLNFQGVINKIPLNDTFLFIFILILFIFLFSFYYVVYRMLSPRWRVNTANILIKKIRNNKFNDAQVMSYLRTQDPFVFEEMLLSLMYERGFKIKRNKKYTGDGGRDGLCWVNGDKTHIQAKRYKSYISKEHMKEFITLTERDKTAGIFIHTGKTGKGTKTLAKEHNINIVSGSTLISFIKGESVCLFNKTYVAKRKIRNK